MKAIAPSKVFSTLGLCLIILSMTSCLKETKVKNSGASAPFNAGTTPVKWSSSAISGGLDLKIDSEIINSFVPADLDGDGDDPVEQMLKQWNNSSSLTMFKVPAGTTTKANKATLNGFKNDGALGVYRSDQWFADVSGQALAVTQYFGYRRNAGAANEYIELFHADIIINYRDYNFSTDASSNSEYDLHSVILHELGHFVGLGHVNSFSTSSVMQPYLSIFDSVRSTSSYDKTTLQNLYGVSALSANPGLQVTNSAITAFNGPKALPKAARENDKGEVRGVIELRADGRCHHYENGIKVHEH